MRFRAPSAESFEESMARSYGDVSAMASLVSGNFGRRSRFDGIELPDINVSRVLKNGLFVTVAAGVAAGTFTPALGAEGAVSDSHDGYRVSAASLADGSDQTETDSVGTTIDNNDEDTFSIFDAFNTVTGIDNLPSFDEPDTSPTLDDAASSAAATALAARRDSAKPQTSADDDFLSTQVSAYTTPSAKGIHNSLPELPSLLDLADTTVNRFRANIHGKAFDSSSHIPIKAIRIEDAPTTSDETKDVAAEPPKTTAVKKVKIPGDLQPDFSSDDYHSEQVFPVAGDPSKLNIHDTDKTGTKIDAPAGTPVVAPLAGLRVLNIQGKGRDGDDGTDITFASPDDETRYIMSGLDDDSVKLQKNQVVEAGSMIGKVAEIDGSDGQVEIMHTPKTIGGYEVRSKLLCADDCGSLPLLDDSDVMQTSANAWGQRYATKHGQAEHQLTIDTDSDTLNNRSKRGWSNVMRDIIAKDTSDLDKLPDLQTDKPSDAPDKNITKDKDDTEDKDDSGSIFDHIKLPGGTALPDITLPEIPDILNGGGLTVDPNDDPQGSGDDASHSSNSSQGSSKDSGGTKGQTTGKKTGLDIPDEYPSSNKNNAQEFFLMDYYLDNPIDGIKADDREEAAAAMVARKKIESSYNPEAENSSGHKGFVQWDPNDRGPAENAWAKENGFDDPWDPKAQLGFEKHELEDVEPWSNTVAQMQSAMDKENNSDDKTRAAARAYTKGYERGGGADKTASVAVQTLHRWNIANN